MVLRVLQDQRGWQPTQLPQDGLPSADFMMQTEHGTRLVACKHRRGYRIGVAAVNELGAMARLAGANGGVMVTESRMEREGLAASEKNNRSRCWTVRAYGRCSNRICPAMWKPAWSVRPAAARSNRA